MHSTNPSESFGTFKLVGHTVITFRSLAGVHAGLHSLKELGFSKAQWVCYSPAEMKAQGARALRTAGPLGATGQDLNLIRIHRSLAEQGCNFLVVHTPRSEQVRTVARVANSLNAVSAQHYGPLTVEQLIDPAFGRQRIFESSRRGPHVSPHEAAH